MTYMNFVDKKLKTLDKNDIMGIIIFKLNNAYVIKYCSDDRVIS